MLKASTRSMLKKAHSHHLSKGLYKKNFGKNPGKKVRAKVAAGRKAQADHIRGMRKTAGGKSLIARIYRGPNH